MAKKFKRYFTGSANRVGKGDDQRPAQVSDAEVARNWCRTFGHKQNNSRLYKKGDVYFAPCKTCGEPVRVATIIRE